MSLSFSEAALEGPWLHLELYRLGAFSQNEIHASTIRRIDPVFIGGNLGKDV
jgi:hypothetical protein